MASEIPGVGGDQDTADKSEVDVLSEGSEDKEVETEEKPEATEEAGETTEEEEEIESEEEVETEEETEEEIEEEEELKASEEPIRPSWQTIKEKYPELAKDKDFRNMYYREHAYSEIYPTVEEAKVASQKAEVLDIIDSKLVEGDIASVFADLNEDVLKGLSTKILPTLYKLNPSYFKAAARPIIIDVIHNVYEQAEKTGDENLKKSIRNVSRALTGSADLPKREAAATDPSVEEERNKLRQDRERLFLRDQNSFLQTVDKRVLSKLEQLVSDGLDPKKELNEFNRRAVVDKTLADVRRALTTDEGLKDRIKQQFKLAVRAGFPEEYKARIVAASLDRARKLIPVLRNKHRSAALGKQPTNGKILTKKVVTTTDRVTTSPSRVTSRNQIDTRRTSAEDFLNDRVTFKK
jgi:hypothetical protein